MLIEVDDPMQSLDVVIDAMHHGWPSERFALKTSLRCLLAGSQAVRGMLAEPVRALDGGVYKLLARPRRRQRL